MSRPGTYRTRVILAVIVTGLALGILQGLPDAAEAVADLFVYPY